MRLVFTVLVLANLALAAYALLLSDRRSPDAALLEQQLNADKVRIIPPPPPAPRRSACLEWGTFSDVELSAARRELERLGLMQRASESRVPVVAGWWVFIPPQASRVEVDRRIAELTALGVTDYYAVEGESAMRNAISLGIFRSEEAAGEFLRGLQARGVRLARMGSREHRVTQTVFVLREPSAQVSAQLAALASRFPGSELRAVSDCPERVSAPAG
jgi:hypothetical protein